MICIKNHDDIFNTLHSHGLWPGKLAQIIYKLRVLWFLLPFLILGLGFLFKNFLIIAYLVNAADQLTMVSK